MGLTSAQLDIVDLTPTIGSEIRTGIDTLLSGGEAANIRETLEQRGVVFFRGLDISDEQQVAIAKTLGHVSVTERGRRRHLQDLTRQERQSAGRVPEGLPVLAFRRFAAALSESRHPAARREAVKDWGRDRVLQHLRRIRRLAAIGQGSRSPSCGWSTVPSDRSTT